jgi:hypothetical protein
VKAWVQLLVWEMLKLTWRWSPWSKEAKFGAGEVVGEGCCISLVDDEGVVEGV